jgi:hypothetical protein
MDERIVTVIIQEGTKILHAGIQNWVNRPITPDKSKPDSKLSSVATEAKPSKVTSNAKIDLPNREDTTYELKRRLAKELYKAELDLANGLMIAGKPCDCLPPGSLVYVVGDNNGILPIDQMFKRKTKKVISHQGRDIITEHMSRNYSGELCQFTFGYMNVPLSPTPEHPLHIVKDGWKWNWRTQGGLHESKLDWVKAKDVGLDDYISFPRFTQVTDLDIIVPGLCEIFGWYIAEGSKTENRIEFTMGHKEKANIEHLKELSIKTFGKAMAVNSKETALGLAFANQEFTDLFEVFGHGASQKRLPDWLLYLPFNKQGLFLRELFKGDGCFSANSIHYATVSQQLAYQLRFILFRLGVIHSLNVRKDNTISHIKGREIISNHPVYSIVISGFALERLSQVCDMPTWKPVGGIRTLRNSGWVGEGSVLLPIKKIDLVPYEGKVYNFSVKDNESYLTPYGSVHNCLSNKHTLQLDACAEELVSQDPDNNVYSEIQDWIASNQHKLNPEAILSGKYKLEYPHMALQFKEFRKRVLGSDAQSSITPSVTPPQISILKVGKPELVEHSAASTEGELTLEEAKKIAAKSAMAEVERRWTTLS